MKIKNLSAYQSSFITAGELKPGVVLTRQVAEIELKDFFNERKDIKEKKAVLYFKAVEGQTVKRGIILNRQQVDSLIGIFGSDETDSWIGKLVNVESRYTTSYGKTYPAFVFSKHQEGDNTK